MLVRRERRRKRKVPAVGIYLHTVEWAWSQGSCNERCMHYLMSHEDTGIRILFFVMVASLCTDAAFRDTNSSTNPCTQLKGARPLSHTNSHVHKTNTHTDVHTTNTDINKYTQHTHAHTDAARWWKAFGFRPANKTVLYCHLYFNKTHA